MFNVKINDRFLVLVLFVIMAVFSLASMVILRTLTDQTKKLRESIETSRFNSETSTFCVLRVSGQINFQEIPYTAEAISKATSDCFVEKENSNGGNLTPFPTQSTVTTTTTTVP